MGRVPSHRLQRLCTRCRRRHSEGKSLDCPDCEEELQRSADGPRDPEVAPPIVHEVLSGPGRPLDPDVRQEMEHRFGRDFGNVRVHSDARAGDSATAVNAEAYTVGSHVVFGPGRYSPRSGAGRGLLAHELVHVLQQSGSVRRSGSLPVEPATTAHEREADDAARRVTAGERPAVSRRSPSTLSRKKGGKRKGGSARGASGCVALTGVGKAASTPSGAGMAVEAQLLIECTAQTDPDTKCVPNPLRIPGAGRKKTRKKGGTGIGPDIMLFHEIAPEVGVYEMEYAEIKPRSHIAGAKRRDTREQHESYIEKGGEMIDRLGDALGFRITGHHPLTTWTPTTPRPFLANPKQILHTSSTGGGLIFYHCIDLEPPERDRKKKKKGKEKKPKKPKRPGAKAGSFGLSLGLFSTGGGAGNVSFGVAIFSEGEAIGTVSAGIVYDSSGVAVGTVTAGGGISNETAAALVASAGLSKESSATVAGAAGAGKTEGSDVTGAGVVGAGEQKGAEGTVVGQVGAGKREGTPAGEARTTEGEAGGTTTDDAAATKAVKDAAEEAAKIASSATDASAAQKELLDHLATLPGDERFAIARAAWIEKILYATAGLDAAQIQSLKRLNWRPGSVSKEELRQRVRAAIEAGGKEKGKGKPEADETDQPPEKEEATEQPSGERQAVEKDEGTQPPPSKPEPESEEVAQERRKRLAQLVRDFDWSQVPANTLVFRYPVPKSPSGPVSGTLYLRYVDPEAPQKPEARVAAFFGGEWSPKGSAGERVELITVGSVSEFVNESGDGIRLDSYVLRTFETTSL